MMRFIPLKKVKAKFAQRKEHGICLVLQIRLVLRIFVKEPEILRAPGPRAVIEGIGIVDGGAVHSVLRNSKRLCSCKIGAQTVREDLGKRKAVARKHTRKGCLDVDVPIPHTAPKAWVLDIPKPVKTASVVLHHTVLTRAAVEGIEVDVIDVFKEAVGKTDRGTVKEGAPIVGVCRL